MPTCPSCRREKPSTAFQAPVATCLVCYAARPWNQDVEERLYSGDPFVEQLAVKELRRRASLSDYSNRKRRRKSKHSEPRWLTPEGEFAGESEMGRTIEALDSTMMRCDGCQREFDVNALTELDQMPSEEKGFACSRCLEENVDKACGICQKRFPLIGMYMHEAKAYCDVCIVDARKVGVDKVRSRLNQPSKESGV